jgi:hypothetical protein
VLFLNAGKLARFTSALATQTTGVAAVGDIGSPVAEAANGDLIVSAKHSGDARFALYSGNRKLQSFVDADAVDPVMITLREGPRRFPSARVPERGAANLLCLNANITRDRALDAAPRAVRIFTQAEGKAKLLGQSLIEPDGSFYVQLPGEMPLRMEVVGAGGKVLRAEKNWWWLRTGEQRVCVGCHAGPERAPDNDVPAILQKTTEPVKMLLDAPRMRATE